MRKWHRWLVVFAGIFLLWIATTGLVGQVISLAGGEHHDKPAAAAGPGAVANGPAAHGDGDDDGPPAKKPGSRDLYHFIIDLHSGNYFGPVGKVISALMGAALVFFALSGMWMYLDMFRKRKRIGRNDVFWK